MANMASTAYAIEGPQKDLLEILSAIIRAIACKDDRYEEYKTCELLGFTERELECKRLGGDISEEPTLRDDVLRFYAEERWGLQDFHELLKERFPDIKVWWIVEECGCGVFCTNDKEGKYFPERYWVDTCIDGIYKSEYFRDKETAIQWCSNLTNGRVKTEEDAEEFNADYEDSDALDENFIYIHEFKVVD